jgi:hypothetical protein
MWDAYAKDMGISLKDGMKVSRKYIDVGLTMFFVGDAAGRMTGHPTSRAKDHADTDRYSR